MGDPSSGSSLTWLAPSQLSSGTNNLFSGPACPELQSEFSMFTFL